MIVCVLNFLKFVHMKLIFNNLKKLLNIKLNFEYVQYGQMIFIINLCNNIGDIIIIH